MNITFEIEYPKRLKELDTSEWGEPMTIDYENSTYDFQTILSDNSTTFLITFKLDNQQNEVSDEIKNRLANKSIEVINRCISRIRTFYHDNTNFILVSPRLIQEARITTTFNEKTTQETFALKQTMPRYLKEFFDYLNEEEHALSLGEKLEIDQAVFLHLIIDAYYSLYDGKYNECVINCATAIESYIFPVIKEWLADKLFNKNEKNAETILLEIPMGLKFELLFGSIKHEYLKHQAKLLENMKRVNKLRNTIIHSGNSASKADAEFALDNSAKLLYIVIMQIDDMEE